MHVAHLQLADFRSYAELDFALEPGVTTFVGRNGQGKTNLVEAVRYLSTLSSHRVASDAPLIRAGAERAIVARQGRQGRALAHARGDDSAGQGEDRRDSAAPPRDRGTWSGFCARWFLRQRISRS